jgi:exodeoxyribonuclease VII small subunit
MPKARKIDFEASLSQLEQLVDQMEEGDLSLEESLNAFEAGVKLTRECQQALQEAEQKVEVLMRQNDELLAEPLDQESRDSDDAAHHES